VVQVQRDRITASDFITCIGRRNTEIFPAIMKTTNAGGTVIDEPKSRDAVKPAVDKRTGSKPAAKFSQIYIDGKFYAEGDAKVSVFDHGLLSGAGIFEGIRFYN